MTKLPTFCTIIFELQTCEIFQNKKRNSQKHFSITEQMLRSNLVLVICLIFPKLSSATGSKV